MKPKLIFKAAPLITLFMYAAIFTMQQANQSTLPMIKILTSDEDVIDVPKDLALQSSFIRNIIGDLGQLDELIPLPNVTAKELDLIIKILQAIKKAPDQVKFKREDGKYIAQRIQPLIDKELGSVDSVDIAQLVYAAQYLDFEQIANGAIRVLVQRALAKDPNETVATIKAAYFFNPDPKLANNTATQKRPQFPDTLDKIFEYQYQLVKNSNTPELSMKDYIAINGMPQMKIELFDITYEMKLSLIGRDITSLEGLNEITNITNVYQIDLDFNKLTTLSNNTFKHLTKLKGLDLNHNKIATIPIGTFNGLINLARLDLSNNELISLPAGVFNGLTNLKRLELNTNHLATLPVGVFNGLTKLQVLNLGTNNLTILPAEIFDGLTNMFELWIRGNPGFRNMTTEELRTQFKLDPTVRF